MFQHYPSKEHFDTVLACSDYSELGLQAGFQLDFITHYPSAENQPTYFLQIDNFSKLLKFHDAH